ncbi:MAG: hypothetical protein IJZ55_09900, partial [Lachnospiraceae bacterium]|nr:hypothetical protein [Lachnospiraceae bacterium]
EEISPSASGMRAEPGRAIRYIKSFKLASETIIPRWEIKNNLAYVTKTLKKIREKCTKKNICKKPGNIVNSSIPDEFPKCNTSKMAPAHCRRDYSK